MVLVLVLGDLFIPTRTHDLPTKFKKLLVPGKIQQIISTGNICDQETWDYLRGVAPDLRGVRGDFDENSNLPPSLVLQHGPLRIGVLHGRQVVPLGDAEALSAVARKMDVDILVSGGTHRFEAYEYDSRFFVNPGSATGAYAAMWPQQYPGEVPNPPPENSPAAETPSSESKQLPAKSSISKDADTGSDTRIKSSVQSEPIPSFALLDIQGPVVVTYVYQLINGEVRVEKVEHRARSRST